MGQEEQNEIHCSPQLDFRILKLQIMEKCQLCQSATRNHTHTGSWPAAYREQVVVSVAAALFLRLFVAGLSTLSLGSTVRMRCGVLVLKSAWPFTWLGFLIWRSLSSSTPTENSVHEFCSDTAALFTFQSVYRRQPDSLCLISCFFWFLWLIEAQELKTSRCLSYCMSVSVFFPSGKKKRV